MGGAWRGNEGGGEGGEDGERSPSRVASVGGSRRRPNRRKSAGIRRQARHRDDTERTQPRHAHGALALWQSCVLPAKIRFDEGEASCPPQRRGQTKVCRSRPPSADGGGKLAGLAQERRILGENARVSAPAPSPYGHTISRAALVSQRPILLRQGYEGQAAPPHCYAAPAGNC